MTGGGAASWKLTLPCTRAEAEALAEDPMPLAVLDPPPALMTRETDPKRPERWILHAYFERRPGKAAVRLLKELLPSAAAAEPAIVRVADRDWAAVSQQGLEPIREGRFYVHTPADRGNVPAGMIAFEIDAGRAFGTGRHETTAGCLATLDALKARGARFGNVCDLGTGTGILAFAALALWPQARAVASDIDPLAIEIARENAAINGVAPGSGPGRLEFVAAAGLAHRRLKRGAPYDLIVANILAGPLIDMAPAVSAALAPGGTLVAAGLLVHQADGVVAAYRTQRCRLAGRADRGEWPVLRLAKRRRPARGHRPASRG